MDPMDTSSPLAGKLPKLPGHRDPSRSKRAVLALDLEEVPIYLPVLHTEAYSKLLRYFYCSTEAHERSKRQLADVTTIFQSFDTLPADKLSLHGTSGYIGHQSSSGLTAIRPQ
ncbi:hypothetical protein CISG_01356 [Coccidioides immitis RMSCC 3703]|uniref:Uncharacterized protein n=2 Tax=Coccidioides immitis TaxID=5501 RepID=A0A0J8QXI5_COCIT|nr:hypothetical protein CIRG_04751 [Coccidioides immitis RMSCC 2394]KMU77599.1 hypothetical protein CISG_01356 [Coccidioides immitis RMSCC 3703]